MSAIDVSDKKIIVLDDVQENCRQNEQENILITKDENDLQKQIAMKDQRIAELEASAAKTSEAISAFYRQQQALFDEFVTLRKKYDDLKETVHKNLWDHCAPHHPDLRHLPSADPSVGEDEERGVYGHYTATDLLGEGQFASVHACTRPAHLPAHSKHLARVRSASQSSLSRRPSIDTTIGLPATTSLSAKARVQVVSKEEATDSTPSAQPLPQTLFAIKIIKKSKIATMHFMRRLAAEIDSLQRLSGSQHVVRMCDVFQTPQHVCLVLERGGSDLFELLRAHSEGLNETAARSVAVELVRAVLHCHRNGICHRDIKPENILVSLDTTSGVCSQLKLCDFGLSCRFEPTQVLRDFCGSPGFFDPDMLIERNYFGDKADAWSIGALLLEVMLGPERFGRLWMPAYDYQILQTRDTFHAAITQVCAQLPLALPFSDELNDFLLGLLSVDSFARTSLHHAGRHPWIKDLMDAAVEASATAGSQGGGRVALRFDIPGEDDDVEDDNARQSARRLADDSSNRGSLSGLLPPIHPPAKTPCVNSARKMMILRDPVESNESLKNISSKNVV